ncbi:MAG: hypothetical protein ACI9JN_002697 [Bacteroidia bacterium]|jgi:hypothetical protein
MDCFFRSKKVRKTINKYEVYRLEYKKKIDLQYFYSITKMFVTDQLARTVFDPHFGYSYCSPTTFNYLSDSLKRRLDGDLIGQVDG